MSKKRRVFDIEMPEEQAAPEVKSATGRRGPMASAIVENADALKARRTAAEAIREENDALAHEYVALREAGHVVQDLPLEEVHTRLLLRDRMPGEDLELDDLVTSIRELGLSNPIRVLPRPDGGGYELVQGQRRLLAYTRLHDETGEGAWARIPALIMGGEADIAGLYRRMVDENVVRKDLSFAEMARAAQNYAADPQTDVDDLTSAVAALFQSSPYSKRSYIRSFAFLLDEMGEALRFPTEIPRALGVSLAREIKERPELVARLRGELTALEERDPEAELAVLRRALSPEAEAVRAPSRKGRAGAKGEASKTKTTFHIGSSVGQVKCTAGPGRLEIKVDRDFSSIDRARLERAVASLIDGLG